MARPSVSEVPDWHLHGPLLDLAFEISQKEPKLFWETLSRCMLAGMEDLLDEMRRDGWDAQQLIGWKAKAVALRFALIIGPPYYVPDITVKIVDNPVDESPDEDIPF